MPEAAAVPLLSRSMRRVITYRQAQCSKILPVFDVDVVSGIISSSWLKIYTEFRRGNENQF